MNFKEHPTWRMLESQLKLVRNTLKLMDIERHNTYADTYEITKHMSVIGAAEIKLSGLQRDVEKRLHEKG